MIAPLLSLLALSLAPGDSIPHLAVRVDSARHEVVLEAGPFHLARAAAHAAHDRVHHGEQHQQIVLPFEWPIDQWCHGFAIELTDGAGRPLPRMLIHHLNVVNFERRQLIHPAFERLLAAGRETDDVRLPGGIAVPLARGDRLALLLAWPAGVADAPDEVHLRLRLPWVSPRRAPAPLAVIPLLIDIGYEAGASDAYDVPPGRSTRTLEFTLPVSGRLLGIGGHLHDHGELIRLEEVESGRVIVELRPHLRDGHVTGMPRKLFGARGDGVKLRAGRHYRATAVYEHGEPGLLRDGAMAVLGGIFAPDDPRALPRARGQDDDLAQDAASLGVALHLAERTPADSVGPPPTRPES
jgi:hypothetical protein